MENQLNVRVTIIMLKSENIDVALRDSSLCRRRFWTFSKHQKFLICSNTEEQLAHILGYMFSSCDLPKTPRSGSQVKPFLSMVLMERLRETRILDIFLESF